MPQMQNAQSVALQLEKVRDKLPLLYERDDILLTMIQQRGDVERVSSRNMRLPLQIRPGGKAQPFGPTVDRAAIPERPAPRRSLLEAAPAGIQVKDDTATTVSIASVSDQDWYVSRTHGIYHIPACPKGEPYALLLVTSRSDALDLGDNRRFPFSISAREIADDLLQDLHDHGIFVCGGARPAADELDKARTRRDDFYHRLVLDADTMWARGHSFREISDMHRRAAIALGIEREWAYVPARMADCPACGEKLKQGVAVCRHCGAILDEEKAAKHGLGKGRSEREKLLS